MGTRACSGGRRTHRAHDPPSGHHLRFHRRPQRRPRQSPGCRRDGSRGFPLRRRSEHVSGAAPRRPSSLVTTERLRAVPRARVSEKGVYDYATHHWAPARVYDYIHDRWQPWPLEPNVVIPIGKQDPLLGYSYVQLSRMGLGNQRSPEWRFGHPGSGRDVQQVSSLCFPALHTGPGKLVLRRHRHLPPWNRQPCEDTRLHSFMSS